MKGIFTKSIIYAVIIHLIVFVFIYFGWFGPMAESGGAFCEAARDGMIKQPSNTFSNLGFAFLGLLAAYQIEIGKFRTKNSLTTYPTIALFFVWLMISLSPGSIAMHATESYLGGYFDMLSMYLVASFITAYSFGRLFSLKPLYYLLVFIITMLICHYFNFLDYRFPFVGFAGNFIFAVLLILGGIIESINHIKNNTEKKMSWGILSILTMLTAFAIWNIGFDDHPWCRPFSFLQAHALWHILDAFAIYFLFRFYVSENDLKFIKP